MSAGLRLMWKEYRVLRGFWLALAIFGLACDGLVFLFVANPEDRLAGFFSLAGVLPACFALGAGATLFALEREESTRDLLQYLPLTSWRIFASKISVALSGTLLLTLVLLMAAVVRIWFAFGESTGAHLAQEGALAGAVGVTAVYTVMVLQAIGWSVFFSLRSARPLLAAFLGAIAALTCISLVHVAAQRHGWFNPPWSWFVPVAHVATTAAIWLIDVWLGSTWLHGRRVVVSPRRAAAPGPLSLSRLLWQEWRSSRRLLAALAVLGLLFTLLQWADPYSGGVGAVPAAGLVLALFGACTFLSDQERSHFRFFAERGVSGRYLWFSRLLFWIGGASVLAAVLLIAHLLIVPLGVLNRFASNNPALSMRTEFVLSWFAVHIGPSGTSAGPWVVTDLSGYVVWLALAFGAGQLCSMFFRSGLLAATFGVILAGVLLAWAALMHVLSIGWWWSVAPLAMALFAATWLRADSWFLERKRFSARLPSVLALAVPVVAILTAVPIYRVLEIPNVNIERLRLAAEPPVNPEANDAVRRLFDRFGQISRTRTKNFPTATDECPPEERKWLTENQAALDALVEAALRLPPDAAAEPISPITATTWRQMATTLIWYAQIAEGDGKLDEAWTRYHSALNVASVARRRGTVLGEVFGDDFERTVVWQLIRWGARKGQTEEWLRAAVAAIEQLGVQNESLADLVWREYRANLAQIDEVQARPPDTDAIYGFAMKWAPWEFTRARRLLRYVAFLDVQDAGAADTAFVAGTKPPTASLRDADRAYVFGYAGPLLQTTLLQGLVPIDSVIEARRWTLCYRRATQLVLAAEWWRLEHGEMPEKLEELERHFGPLRPDPYTTQPFLWFPWGLRLPARSRNLSEIPAKTPLLYTEANSWLRGTEQEDFELLRRESADEPTMSVSEIVKGKAGVARGKFRFEGRGMAVGIANTSAALEVGSSHVHLGGLAFPIPNAKDELDAPP